MNGIFINYRRQDSSAYAGRLYDALVHRFGHGRVFMDIDTIGPGQDFREVIQRTCASCGVFIAVIGNEWATIRDKNGCRRLENDTDFVRMEIASALQKNIPTIPVLVGGAEMPEQLSLPPDIRRLVFLNAWEISDKRFVQDVQGLEHHIAKLLNGRDLFWRRFLVDCVSNFVRNADQSTRRMWIGVTSVGLTGLLIMILLWLRLTPQHIPRPNVDLQTNRVVAETSTGESDGTRSQGGTTTLSSTETMPGATQGGGPASTGTMYLDVSGRNEWTSTGITVQQGQRVTITASGEVKFSYHDPPEGPEGGGKPCYPNPAIHRWTFPAPNLSCHSLVARIGDNGAPFEIGRSTSFRATASGVLYLGVNDNFLGDNSGSWRVAVTAPPASAALPATGSTELANQNVSLRDDFASDHSLNGSLWTTNGAALSTRVLKADTRFMPVRLAFTNRGLTLGGVNDRYQSTGIQSKRTFTAPLTLEAIVMGTVSNGNPFALYLVSSDGSQYLAVNANLDSQGGGVSFGHTGSGNDSGKEKSASLMQGATVETWYVIRFVIDPRGVGVVSIEDREGGVLGKASQLYVGNGPFYVVLAQWAGWPRTTGPNEAIWASITISAPDQGGT